MRAGLMAAIVVVAVAVDMGAQWKITDRLNDLERRIDDLGQAERRAQHARSQAIPADPIPVDGSYILGSKTAHVVMIEFSDFQCPYCGAFARETLPLLQKQYVDTGKVRVAFRYLPLETLHPYSYRAAETAECAGEQGRFWAVHDLFFRDQVGLDDEGLRQKTQAAGVDASLLATCLQSGRADQRVKRDLAAARDLGISGTPAFLVGLSEPDGRVKIAQALSGSRPTSEFRAAIDALLGSGH